MVLRCLTAIVIASFWSIAAPAASIEQAWDTDGQYRWGLKIEGEIAPGDAATLLTKLLDFYVVFGPSIDTVYLMSRGGNVEEAIKMGTIIRRLRLKTEVPGWDKNAALSTIAVNEKRNLICASACFLVYAGGVDRFGNYLALHRPSLPKEAASKLSDVQYEQAQKEEMAGVREYLLGMEVDPFWIDRMMATSSQDSYVTTWSEVDDKVRHLMGTVPSIEEIELVKCPDNTADLERRIGSLNSLGRPLTDDEWALRDQLVAQSHAFFTCKDKALEDMRKAAFEREIEATMMPACANLTPLEQRQLSELGTQREPLTADEKSLKSNLMTKYFAFWNCRSHAMGSIQDTAFRRLAPDIHRMELRDKGRPATAGTQ